MSEDRYTQWSSQTGLVFTTYQVAPYGEKGFLIDDGLHSVYVINEDAPKMIAAILKASPNPQPEQPRFQSIPTDPNGTNGTHLYDRQTGKVWLIPDTGMEAKLVGIAQQEVTEIIRPKNLDPAPSLWAKVLKEMREASEKTDATN